MLGAIISKLKKWNHTLQMLLGVFLYVTPWSVCHEGLGAVTICSDALSSKLKWICVGNWGEQFKKLLKMDVGIDTEKLPVFLWLCGTGLQIWAKKVLRIDQEIAQVKNLGRLACSSPVWIVLLGFVCFGFCFIGWCVFGLFFSRVPWLVTEGILPAQTFFPEVHDAQLCTPQGHPEQSIQSHQFTSMKSVLITLIGCSPFSWIS